jgi:hypothetical protein
LRRLLSYEYLLEPVPGQTGPFRFLYLLLGLGTCCALLVAIRWRGKRTAKLYSPALLETVLSLCGVTLVACALGGLPYLSMRILVLGTNLLAWFFPFVVWMRQRESVDTCQRHLRALAGRQEVVQKLLPRYTSLLLLGLHILGLAAIAAHYRWPLWCPLLLLLALLSPQLAFSFGARRWRVHLEGLAPLLLVYGMLALRLLVLTLAKLLGYPHFSLPAPWDSLLNVDWALLVAIPWALLAQAHSILRYQRREAALLPGMAVLWLVLSFVWTGYTYLHLRTHGVTGTDPYGYAQMAVDLAERGVPVHAFPLVRHLEQLVVFPEAGVHLGYHLPFDESGRAATVWPFGQSVLLAVGYRLMGEEGLYLTTPLLGLLSLVALAALSWQLLVDRTPGERLLVCAVAVFALGTSYAQLERLVVPMADAAAQLFTTLTVVLWLRAMQHNEMDRATANPRSHEVAFLAGLSFGAAYLVRHTQLVLMASVLFVAWASPLKLRYKTALVTCFAVASLLVAIPDLWYHQWVMGSWLRPESLELRHFSWAFAWPMAARMVRELFTAREFLYLGPFILYGLWRQMDEDGLHFGALAMWLLAVALIHLPYEALRLRDLLSVFPVLCFWAGYGVASIWRALRDRQWWSNTPLFLRGLGYGLLLALLLALRTRTTLGLAHASDFDAFGYLNALQRAGFSQIRQATEATALVGASLNSGAVELYGMRTTFRPADWRPDELYTFADDALARGAPLYLLEDGLEMGGPLTTARQRYDLELVGRYDIPFYHIGGGSTGGRVPLYRVENRTD